MKIKLIQIIQHKNYKKQAYNHQEFRSVYRRPAECSSKKFIYDEYGTYVTEINMIEKPCIKMTAPAQQCSNGIMIYINRCKDKTFFSKDICHKQYAVQHHKRNITNMAEMLCIYIAVIIIKYS